MKTAIVVLLTLLAVQSPSTGSIEGRIVHPGTREPISDALITLVASTPTSATVNFAPDVATRLSLQINELVESGNRAGINQEVIDNAVENARRNAGLGGRQLTVLTDSSGHFSFRDLTPGRYTLRAEREGYFALPINGSSSTTLTKTITVQEGKTSSSEELLMVKGAVISGSIRDPNGQVIPGMNVTVFRVTYTNGRKIWTAFNSKTTDDRGEYRMFWLAPGDYYVGVVPRAPGTVPGPQDTWARTFFPGATEPSDATVVRLKDGGEGAGTDITIRTSSTRLFTISGVAINSFARANAAGVTDKSIASFVLSPRDPGVLDNPNPPQVSNALPASSRANGEFEIRNVRPGAYDLFPMAPVLTDPAPGSSAVPPNAGTPVPDGRVGVVTTVQVINGNVVTLTGTPGSAVPTIRRQPTSRTPVDVHGDITNLRISVNNGAPFSGEVVVNGTASPAIKLDSIRLILRSLDTTPASFANLIGTIPVDASGRFSVPNIPEARYTLQLTGIPATAFVADIRQAGASVTDSGFVLDASASPVQVVIEPNGSTVQGAVQNAEGKPAGNATVVLIPASPRRQNTLLYRTTTTNETGAFTLKGVPRGQFTIFAWESVLPTAWQNADFIAKYEGRGRPITISGASTPDLQLNLILSEDTR